MYRAKPGRVCIHAFNLISTLLHPSQTRMLSMKLEKVGVNQTVLTINQDMRILFSYSTPVAAWTRTSGYLRTCTKHSNTTQRHITAWLAHEGASFVNVVPQDMIDALLD